MSRWERAELLALGALRGQGYQVHRARPVAQRYGEELHLVGNDFWGLFDLIAVSGDNLRFVQVKTGDRYYGPEKLWKERLDKFARPPSVSCEWWWLDEETGLWRMTRFDREGVITA